MKRPILVVFVLGCVSLVCVAGQSAATTPPANSTPPSANSATPTPATKHAPPINTNRPPTKESVIVPSYELKTSDGKTCILMQFNFVLKIAFTTTDGDSGNIEVKDMELGVINTSGNCTGDDRTVRLTVADYTNWQIRFEFAKRGKGGDKFELKDASVHWKYEEPFFKDNVKDFGVIETATMNHLDISAATGKTFTCSSRSEKTGPATFTISNIKIQPYAQESSDKGSYGAEEECSSSSSLSAGAIIAIIVGVIVVIIIVAGGVFFLCRRRKKSEYTSV